MENINNREILKKSLFWLSVMYTPSFLSFFTTLSIFKRFNWLAKQRAPFLFIISVTSILVAALIYFLYITFTHLKKKDFDLNIAKDNFKKISILGVMFSIFGAFVLKEKFLQINIALPLISFFAIYMIEIFKIILSDSFLIKNIQNSRYILRILILLNLFFTIIAIFYPSIMTISPFVSRTLIFATPIIIVLPYFFNNEHLKNIRKILILIISIHFFIIFMSIFAPIGSPIPFSISSNLSSIIYFLPIFFDANRIRLSKAKGKEAERLAIFSAFSLNFAVSRLHLIYYFLNDEKTDKQFN